MKHSRDWQGICPVCKSEIGTLTWPGKNIDCGDCLESFKSIEGIYQLIQPGRLNAYKQFLDDYTSIRIAEGRGDHGHDYYCRLPEPTVSDPLSWQWKIRSKSFKTLVSVLDLESTRQRRILDLGAGVGWLCHRVASLGHYPIAIDINMDEMDGLRAGRFYDRSWPCIQAEFDNLPIQNEQADLAIFNASLHYSTDYYGTLKEALRVLRGDGQLVIIDSPIYRRPDSGINMKLQRHEFFNKVYGFRSDSIDSIEFLTWGMLEELEKKLEVKWRIIRPWYGLRWAMRPLTYAVKESREASTFAILMGTRA